jgi:hypothetical protein
MVGRVLGFFCAIFMTIVYLGFYCLSKEIVSVSLFDTSFITAFVLGGAFPYLISFVFQESIEDNTNIMVS